MEKWIYDWGLLMEYSIASYWIGQYEEAKKASLQILENTTLPEHVKERVRLNLQWIDLEIQKRQLSLKATE